MPETYIRGNTIKYLRVPDEVIDKVKEEDFRRDGMGQSYVACHHAAICCLGPWYLTLVRWKTAAYDACRGAASMRGWILSLGGTMCK